MANEDTRKKTKIISSNISNYVFFFFKGRIFSAPFQAVQFADFWLADQLTSFEFIFTDLQFIICYYLMETTFSPFKRMLFNRIEDENSILLV